MIACIFESRRCHPRNPVTVEGCDVGDWDFNPCAKQAYAAVYVLYMADLISEMPFDDTEDVHELIYTLIEDIDLDNPELQESERDHIRVTYLEYMLGIEVVLGV